MGQGVISEKPALGIVFKSINDPFIGQLTFLRVVSGVFKSDRDVFNLTRPGNKEHLGTLFFMNGKSQTGTSEAGPGAIFAVAKLKETRVGDSLSTSADTVALPEIEFRAGHVYAVTARNAVKRQIRRRSTNRRLRPTVRCCERRTHESCFRHGTSICDRSETLHDQFKESRASTPRSLRETITHGEDTIDKKQTAARQSQKLLRSLQSVGFDSAATWSAETIPKTPFRQ